MMLSCSRALQVTLSDGGRREFVVCNLSAAVRSLALAIMRSCVVAVGMEYCGGAK